MSKTGSKLAEKRPVLLPRIEPVEGERGCYWVQSRSRLNMRHRVDMWEYGGNGACGCEDFAIRFKPHLEKGAKPALVLACRHLKAARELSALEFWPMAVQARDEADRKRKQEQKGRNQNDHATHEDYEAL